MAQVSNVADGPLVLLHTLVQSKAKYSMFQKSFGLFPDNCESMDDAS
jgi:hypothetical protein